MIRKIFAVLGLFYAASTAQLAAQPAAQPAMLDIKVGTIQASDHAMLFAGVERGIFAKYGLNAKMVFYPTGVEMLNGMVAGQQDVSLLGSAPFLAAAGNGAPLVLIGHLHGDATRNIYSEPHSVVAAEASGLKVGDIAGLKGKRIGLARGTVSEVILTGLLKGQGLTLADVTLVNSPPPNLPTLLRTGDVQAVVAWEPWATVATMRVPGAVRVSRGDCPTCYDVGTIVTTRQEISTKAETLRRFALAFAESQQWLRNNFDAACEINMHYIQGVDLDVMKVAIRNETYDMRVSRNVVDAYNGNLIPLMVSNRQIPKAFDAATVVDPQFYLYAQKTAPQFFTDLKPIPEAAQFK